MVGGLARCCLVGIRSVGSPAFFLGTLTVPAVNAREQKIGELQVTGVLPGQFQGASARFTPLPMVLTSSGAIPREALVQLRIGALSCGLVFERDQVFKSVDPSRVLYDKGNAGVEFGGTDPVCLARTKRTGLAELKAQTDVGSDGFQGYKLTPRCGRINTPTGSFAGIFSNGKPDE